MTTNQVRERTADDMAAMIKRCMRALVKRAAEGDGEAVVALRHLTAHCRFTEEEAVQALMDSPADPSWNTIAMLTGTTRQAAMQRYARCSPSRTAGGQPGHLR